MPFHLLHHHLLRHRHLLLVTAMFVLRLVRRAVAHVLMVESLAAEAASLRGKGCAECIFGKSLRGFYEDLQLQQMRVIGLIQSVIVDAHIRII